MNILVTGAKGMVGTALCNNLKNIRDGKNKTRPALDIKEIYEYDLDSTSEELDEYCQKADFVFNLAGVNRPENPEDFMKGNFGFASDLLNCLKKHNNKATIMLSSSIQATLAGRQKRDWIGLALNLWAILAALLCAVRAVADSSSDERYFMPALVLAAAWAFRKGRGTAWEPLFWLGFLPGMAAYAFILRSTLLGFSATFMYLTWPALCGCFAMLACRQENPEQGKLPQGQCVLAALLVFLLVCRFWCVLVTGWKPANVATANLKQITAGPAAGTWADGKAADMQMALYEALEPFAGKQVLQAIGEQHGLGFMMAGGTLTIGQASVISGTDSDPRFIQYYEELPEKRPDVILYDEAEVRDMAAFHAWIEENFTITARYPVTHGTAHLQVLVVD